MEPSSAKGWRVEVAMVARVAGAAMTSARFKGGGDQLEKAILQLKGDGAAVVEVEEVVGWVEA